MTPSVPDTSVWITFLRQGNGEAFIRRGLRTGTVLLASVVAYELYLGAASIWDRRDLGRIEAAFTAAGLTVTPDFDDWCAAATLIQRYSRLHGSIDPRDHVNDTLIVLCAARLRASVATWNVKDMSRWNRMLPVRRRVRLLEPGA